jgi:hypothetical protein
MGGALQLWLPVERFDDAMLLLRHTLRWELIDITYAVLFDSRRAAATRWDGKRIKPTPKTKACTHALTHTHAHACVHHLRHDHPLCLPQLTPSLLPVCLCCTHAVVGPGACGTAAGAELAGRSILRCIRCGL